MTFIQLDYDTWFEKFKPITKTGTDHIAFDTHDDIDFLRTHLRPPFLSPGFASAAVPSAF